MRIMPRKLGWRAIVLSALVMGILSGFSKVNADPLDQKTDHAPLADGESSLLLTAYLEVSSNSGCFTLRRYLS